MIEKEYEIIDSDRTIERNQVKKLESSACAYLVELITNSDDSYKRLETDNKSPAFYNSIKPIYIFYKKDKNNKFLSVIDNAEGISKERAIEIFQKYGGENAGGASNKSRGLFGQGATDVMKNAAMYKQKAEMISCYDNQWIKFQWRKNNDGKFMFVQKDFEIRNSQIGNFRIKNRIPKNGTIMTFGIPQSIKFDPNKIIDELSAAFALRFILSAKNRKVIYINDKGFETELSSKKYLLNKENLKKSYPFKFEFDNFHFDCKLDLYEYDFKNSLGSGATQILIYDSNKIVYANEKFGWGKTQKWNKISGMLKIDGLYKYCEFRLNNSPKIEIINDDRTGLNRKIDFYDELDKKIDKYINEFLEQNVTAQNEIDISKDKRIKDYIKELNKLFSEDTQTKISGGSSKGKTPPDDGMEFPRNSISITKGKGYSLVLYINPSQISEGEMITLKTNNNNDNISHPAELRYDKSDVKNDIVTKQISIKALNETSENNFVELIATYKNKQKSIFISVIKEEIIYPANGLQFQYTESIFVENKKIKKVPLWFDLSFLPKDSEISLSIKGMNLINQTIKLNDSFLKNETVGLSSVDLEGGILGNDYVLNATAMNNDGKIVSTSTKILIRNTEKNISGTQGLFNLVKLWSEPWSTDFQITYDEKTKTIYINPFNPINKALMPDLGEKDPENPKFTSKEYLFLEELLSWQFAISDVKELERKSQIVVHDSDDRLMTYVDHINKKKEIGFKRLHKVNN